MNFFDIDLVLFILLKIMLIKSNLAQEKNYIEKQLDRLRPMQLDKRGWCDILWWVCERSAHARSSVSLLTSSRFLLRRCRWSTSPVKAAPNPPYRSWHTHEAWQVSSGRSRSAFMWRSSAVMVSHTQQQLVYQTEMQFVGASSLCNPGNPFNARHLVQTTGEARYRPVHKHTIPFRPWHAVVLPVFGMHAPANPLANLRTLLWRRCDSLILMKSSWRCLVTVFEHLERFTRWCEDFSQSEKRTGETSRNVINIHKPCLRHSALINSQSVSIIHEEDAQRHLLKNSFVLLF